MIKAFEQAYEKIKKAKTIAILPHKDADGDALGSAYGLKSALISMGKNAFVMRDEIEPHKLFSVLCDTIDEPTEADLAISVDCADLKRLGRRAEFFQSMGENTVAFDHHKSFDNFANVNYMDWTAGACAEIIYQFIKFIGIEITPNTANNLYLGISSDTGGFRQSNATPQSLEIGADLMRKGAKHGQISTALFLSNTLTHTRLTAEVLSTLQMFHNNEISVLYVTQEIMEKLGANNEEAEGLVNFARNIIGVKIAIFLRERVDDEGKPYIKISTRSNDDKYDVAKMCSFLGGGGHLRAAGGEIWHNDMPKAIKEIVEVAENYIESVDNSL